MVARTHRRVDFIRNKQDLEVLLLGSMGFATDFIMERTGLTVGQVLYRLGLGAIKRKDYRNGSTAVAQYVLGSLRRGVAERVTVPEPKEGVR
jgi:hypothetical protein